MADIAGSRALYSTIVTMQADMNDLMTTLWSQIDTYITSSIVATGPNGTIPTEDNRGGDPSIEVRARIGQLVDDLFTGKISGRAGRYAYGEDGVSPLAPYARLMNKWLGLAVRGVVEGHATYMRRVVPDDLQAQLRLRMRISEQDGDGPEFPDFSLRPLAGPSAGSGGVSGVSAARRAFFQRYANLRIFRPNPLAVYEPPHTWVDPNGYRLSDRIWNTSQYVRRQIDQLVARGIADGTSAVDISKAVEQYVIPSRRFVIAKKPYGNRYGKLSFDAMRLARSEIARAHGMAAKMSGIMNPYVEAMIWALSASHPKPDICDGLADGSPYPVDDTPVPVENSHPQCICHLRSAVTKTPAQVTAELREALIEAEQLNLYPYATPLEVEAFTSVLLGVVQSMLTEFLGLAA